MRVCVRVCVCVCVCVYTLSSQKLIPSATIPGRYLRVRSCVVSIMLGASARSFISVSFTTKDENSSEHELERKRYDILYWPKDDRD